MPDRCQELTTLRIRILLPVYLRRPGGHSFSMPSVLNSRDHIGGYDKAVMHGGTALIVGQVVNQTLIMAGSRDVRASSLLNRCGLKQA